MESGNNPKYILLMPVKNEGWILKHTLENAFRWADQAIIADQQSTDDTQKIIKSFENTTIIDNPKRFHSNQVRWLLLEKARELLSGNNIMVCLDAHEAVAGSAVEKIKQLHAKGQPGDVFSLQWINTWSTKNKYVSEGAFSPSSKPIALWDNREMDYERSITANDHTSRVPENPKGENHNTKIPVLHLQFLYPKQAQIKQAWYRCSELITTDKGAKKINHTYSDTLQTPSLDTVPHKWLENTAFPDPNEIDTIHTWHYDEIQSWFNEHGIEYFEPLQIWHIDELRERFINEVGREPKPKTYPDWLVKINNWKNAFKNKFL